MAENNEEKKLGFFKKVLYSISKFEKYPEMAAEGVPRAFKYLAQLMLIFSIIVAGGFVFKLQDTAKKGIDYVQNELPDITYSDGKLDVKSNEAITIDNTGELFIDKIIIDTKVEIEEQINSYIESIPTDTTGVVVLKDKVIVKPSGANGETTYTYSEILNNLTNQEIKSLTKQDVVNYITGSSMISVYAMFFVLMLIYVFIIYSISVLIDTLLIAILGNITIIFTKLKLKFSAVYSMAIYALTLSILLNAIYITINSITGFEMKYFQIMYTAIAYVCLVAALFMIRSDLVKRQAELIKIREEQEKVRQEMEEKKEQEEEEKQKDNKKPDDDKKEEGQEEKDKKEEKSPDGTEPTGSEAIVEKEN